MQWGGSCSFSVSSWLDFHHVHSKEICFWTPKSLQRCWVLWGPTKMGSPSSPARAVMELLWRAMPTSAGNEVHGTQPLLFPKQQQLSGPC